MEIRDCQMFIELATSQHFGKAANACHLSPSAISRQLQRLETEIGKRLVERDNREVRLTPAGRHFLEYAYQTVQAWQQLRRDLSDDPQTVSGELSVYGSVTASFSLLSEILPVLRARYPGVELKLRTGDQADGLERVLTNQEDCAIAAQPAVLPQALAFLALTLFTFSFVEFSTTTFTFSTEFNFFSSIIKMLEFLNLFYYNLFDKNSSLIRNSKRFFISLCKYKNNILICKIFKDFFLKIFLIKF